MTNSVIILPTLIFLNRFGDRFVMRLYSFLFWIQFVLYLRLNKFLCFNCNFIYRRSELFSLSYFSDSYCLCKLSFSINQIQQNGLNTIMYVAIWAVIRWITFVSQGKQLLIVFVYFADSYPHLFISILSINTYIIIKIWKVRILTKIAE
jgi:hypothetical protein